jgi:endonuclease/exonuclease/phosphatase family metal-dependent hydrolase
MFYKQQFYSLSMVLVVILITASCAKYGLNYLDPEGPRCASSFRSGLPLTDTADAGRFTIVSFNIKFGKNPDKALATIADADLDNIDLLLLQEMDLPGTIMIAQQLEYNYVYYPAAIHPSTGKQFGLAILSPWPIRHDRKILLPNLQSSDDIRKIAMTATVWIKGIPVGVINVHLQSGLSPVQTGDQLQVLTGCVFTEVCPQPGAPMLSDMPYYILAGDLNTRSTDSVRVADEVLGWSGLRRVAGINRTHKYLPSDMGNLDHIYISKGMAVRDAGTVPGFFDTGSDHLPVYAELGFEGENRDPWDGFDNENIWDAHTPLDSVDCRQSISVGYP